MREPQTGGAGGEGGAGEVLEAGDEFLERRGLVGFAGDFEEEVEVVGEDAPGEDADAAEGGVLDEELVELLAFEVVEGEAAVDDTGEAVVVAGGVVGRSLPTGKTHARQ
jgi:hypothetical protein